jgi:hypothetical protein
MFQVRPGPARHCLGFALVGAETSSRGSRVPFPEQAYTACLSEKVAGDTSDDCSAYRYSSSRWWAAVLDVGHDKRGRCRRCSADTGPLRMALTVTRFRRVSSRPRWRWWNGGLTYRIASMEWPWKIGRGMAWRRIEAVKPEGISRAQTPEL